MFRWSSNPCLRCRDESIAIQNKDKNFSGRNVTEWAQPTAIQSLSGPVSANKTQLAVPIWQIYPTVPSQAVYGIDLLQVVTEEITEVLKTGKVVVGRSINLESDELNAISTSFAEGIVGKDFPASEPFGVFYYPVNENSNRYVQQDETRTDLTVALMGGSFFWRTMLQGHLPSDAVGLVVVVQNNCGQVFTYQVDGTRATYLGIGDAHETLFKDSLVRLPNQGNGISQCLISQHHFRSF